MFSRRAAPFHPRKQKKRPQDVRLFSDGEIALLSNVKRAGHHSTLKTHPIPAVLWLFAANLWQRSSPFFVVYGRVEQDSPSLRFRRVFVLIRPGNEDALLMFSLVSFGFSIVHPEQFSSGGSG